MALQAGVMHVTLMFAKDLRNRDWFGRQDPYCILQCGSQQFRSKTHVNGGRDPVWDETFNLEIVNENDLKITIYDADTGSRDDTIGTTDISFTRARQQGTDTIEAPVMTHHGKQHGMISVRLQFEGNYQMQQPYQASQPAYAQPPPNWQAQPPAMYSAPPPYQYEQRPVYVEERPVYVEERPVYVEERPVYVEEEYVEERPVYVMEERRYM